VPAPAPEVRADRPPPRVRRPPPVDDIASPPPAATLEAPRDPEPSSDAPHPEVRVDPELSALETEFVALDGPADAPPRIALLDRLAAA